MARYCIPCVCALVLLLAVGCASTAVAGTDYSEQIAQNVAQGLPRWAHCAFSDKEAASFLNGYAEKGLYASGAGASEVAARLDARTNLAAFVTATYGKTASADSLVGSRRLDQFAAEDGTVYVLLYISAKDAKKSF